MYNLLKRVFICLDSAHKKKLIFIQILSIISALLTVLSAVSVAPFVALLFDPNIVLENEFIQNYTNLHNNYEVNELLIIAASVLVLLYTLSILFNILVTYINTKWSTDIVIYFGKTIFKIFLNKNWLFHVNSVSSDLISKTHHDTGRLKGVIIDPALELITNLLLSSFLFITIILVDYKVALISLSCFALFYLFFHKISKKKMRVIGDEITLLYPEYYKSMYDSFSSIRDTVLYKKKKFFFNIFDRTINKLNYSMFHQQFILKLPRNIIEIIAFSIIIIVTIYFVELRNYEFSKIASLLAFYGICTLKILPSLQKIFLSISIINSHESAFSRIEKYLLEEKENNINFYDENNNDKLLYEIGIELRNISFHYPGARAKGISNVNLKIPKNKIIGISGKTGAGKSTLIDVMTCFLKPDEGEIRVDNEIINSKNIHIWQNCFSFVHQKIFIGDYTLRQNIAFGVEEEKIDDNKIKEILKMVCLDEFANNLSLKLGENGERISGGQKQRVAIAKALYKSSEIMFLDEATSSLDTLTEKKILKNLSENKNLKSIIIITHRLETLKLCDQVFHVEDGKVEKMKSFQDLSKKF